MIKQCIILEYYGMADSALQLLQAFENELATRIDVHRAKDLLLKNVIACFERLHEFGKSPKFSGEQKSGPNFRAFQAKLEHHHRCLSRCYPFSP